MLVISGLYGEKFLDTLSRLVSISQSRCLSFQGCDTLPGRFLSDIRFNLAIEMLVISGLLSALY